MGNCCSPGCRLWCLWWCLFVLSFFPRAVLDEILNLIESVSEGFPSYSYKNFSNYLIVYLIYIKHFFLQNFVQKSLMLYLKTSRKYGMKTRSNFFARRKNKYNNKRIKEICYMPRYKYCYRFHHYLIKRKVGIKIEWYPFDLLWNSEVNLRKK